MIKNYVTHIQTHEKLCITKGCVPTLDVANISKPINYISCYSCQLLGKKNYDVQFQKRLQKYHYMYQHSIPYLSKFLSITPSRTCTLPIAMV